MKYITDILVTKIKDYSEESYVSSYDEDVKKKILEHLRSYPARWFTTQPAEDALTGKRVAEADNGYTDGEYTWVESEIYYFEKYDLALKQDFIDHVLAK